MSDIIRTENLVKKFRRVEALESLNLVVPQGAIYALVGPNGAGKTTAIKILMNIVEATSGRAEVMGEPSTELRGAKFASIGYVSENQKLPEWMRVDAFLSYLRPFYPTWDSALESELLKLFNLPLDRKLKHLSRGMKMKAALASALAYHPKLIVLDEPFTGLDPLVRDELIQALLERAEEASVFISSHDLGEIESFATHVGYLDSGRLVFSQELNSLIKRFRVVELTFEGPSVLPAATPKSWLQVNSAAAVVRFIASDFDEQRTTSEVAQVFGPVRNVAFTPMSLREIFLVMAKSGREFARGAHA